MNTPRAKGVVWDAVPGVPMVLPFLRQLCTLFNSVGRRYSLQLHSVSEVT